MENSETEHLDIMMELIPKQQSKEITKLSNTKLNRQTTQIIF